MIMASHDNNDDELNASTSAGTVRELHGHRPEPPSSPTPSNQSLSDADSESSFPSISSSFFFSSAAHSPYSQPSGGEGHLNKNIIIPSLTLPEPFRKQVKIIVVGDIERLAHSEYWDDADEEEGSKEGIRVFRFRNPSDEEEQTVVHVVKDARETLEILRRLIESSFRSLDTHEHSESSPVFSSEVYTALFVDTTSTFPYEELGGLIPITTSTLTRSESAHGKESISFTRALQPLLAPQTLERHRRDVTEKFQKWRSESGSFSHDREATATSAIPPDSNSSSSSSTSTSSSGIIDPSQSRPALRERRWSKAEWEREIEEELGVSLALEAGNPFEAVVNSRPSLASNSRRTTDDTTAKTSRIPSYYTERQAKVPLHTVYRPTPPASTPAVTINTRTITRRPTQTRAERSPSESPGNSTVLAPRPPPGRQRAGSIGNGLLSGRGRKRPLSPLPPSTPSHASSPYPQSSSYPSSPSMPSSPALPLPQDLDEEHTAASTYPVIVDPLHLPSLIMLSAELMKAVGKRVLWAPRLGFAKPSSSKALVVPKKNRRGSNSRGEGKGSRERSIWGWKFILGLGLGVGIGICVGSVLGIRFR